MLIAGGSDSSGVLANAELYNPASGTFTPIGSMNTPRYFQTATLLNNGLVLMAGGFNGGYLASAELYDPAAGMFTPTGSLNNARYFDTATLLNNGMVLMAAGYGALGGGGYGILASAELCNPATGTFTPTRSLNTARAGNTATLLNNGLVLIAGGITVSSPYGTASAELYDPATGMFTPTGSLNKARFQNTMTLLDNSMVLGAGGENTSGAIFASAELY